MKSEELRKTLWESDQPTVPIKSLKEDGGKRLTVVPESGGKHSPHAEADKRVGTQLGILTEKARANPKLRFTSLAHLLNKDFLKGCFEEIRRRKAIGGRPKASGVDGSGVEEYAGESGDESDRSGGANESEIVSAPTGTQSLHSETGRQPEAAWNPGCGRQSRTVRDRKNSERDL